MASPDVTMIGKAGAPKSPTANIDIYYTNKPEKKYEEIAIVKVGDTDDDWSIKHNVINLRPNSLFCRKISSIHHHLKESEMNSVPAVPTTDQAVLPKII